MTITQTNKALRLASAIAVIGWAAAYGYEEYKFNECRQDVTTLVETNQARIKNSEARTVRIRAREESLSARSTELIRTLNGPDNPGAK
jgi:hypothetical protein